MNRARVVSAALVVSSLCAAAPAIAQTTPAEGWVVLPVEEYRALRERANPPASCRSVSTCRAPGRRTGS